MDKNEYSKLSDKGLFFGNRESDYQRKNMSPGYGTVGRLSQPNPPKRNIPNINISIEPTSTEPTVSVEKSELKRYKHDTKHAFGLYMTEGLSWLFGSRHQPTSPDPADLGSAPPVSENEKLISKESADGKKTARSKWF